MTDVSNLDDLAGGISSKSPAIKTYAKAQAAATQAQELDIQTALANGGGTSPPPATGSGLYPKAPDPTGGDDQPMLQNFLNSVPNGTAFALAPKTYKLNRPLDFSSKYAIRVVGLGNRGFNEGGIGTTLAAGAANISLVKDYSPTSVKHTSVNFEHVNFVDHQGGCTGVELTGCNHWIFHHCSWEGDFKQGVYLDNINNTDNAYGVFEVCNWSMHGGLAIWAKSGECHLIHGNIASKSADPNTGGGVIRIDSDGSTIYGVKWNNWGPALDLRGGCHKITACQFESWPRSGFPDEYVVSITRPGAGLSGNRNLLMGCTLIGHDSGINFLYLGPNTYKNIIASCIAQNPKIPYKNDGLTSGTDANRIDILV